MAANGSQQHADAHCAGYQRDEPLVRFLRTIRSFLPGKATDTPVEIFLSEEDGQPPKFVFATAQYESGDWDSAPLVPANVIDSIARYTSIDVAPTGAIVALMAAFVPISVLVPPCRLRSTPAVVEPISTPLG